jgi:hypothetical protein
MSHPRLLSWCLFRRDQNEHWRGFQGDL